MLKQLSAFLLAAAVLGGQSLSKLPDWARPHMEKCAGIEPPKDADAWVILDRTEIAYTGEGEIRKHRFRLVRVLGERGLGEAFYVITGVGGKASKVRKLRGWNLRPDGEMIRLEQENVLSTDQAIGDGFSTRTKTLAGLTGVVKGSLIAFESEEVIKHPLGPIDQFWPMDEHPVRRWELELARKGGWFNDLKDVKIHMDCFHFQPWIPSPEIVPDQRVAVNDIPALPKMRDEHFAPHPDNVLPRVSVRFLDSGAHSFPSWVSWDTFAIWNSDRFGTQDARGEEPDLNGLEAPAGLLKLHDWMLKELRYKQVYLTPERGWIPVSAEESARRRYGDCKDLTCFFLTHARRLGLKGYPALARIVEGQIEGHEPPSLLFNHVISAIRLDKPYGLPAEFETPKGRFLLMDPTDRFVPLGWLGELHRGRRIMVCLPDGAQWIKVPDSAILPRKVTVRIKGSIEEFGALKASVLLEEHGNGWGLRDQLHGGGEIGLKEFLLKQVLNLPPTTTLGIVKTSDTTDLKAPLSLELIVQSPKAWQTSDGEARLPSLLLWIVPEPIQKPGLPRTYPVTTRPRPDFDYTAEIQVPAACTPLLAEKRTVTPFRELAWTAECSTNGTGHQIRLRLSNVGKAAEFDFPQREVGVTEGRKDRNLVRNLLADGFTFKLKP
jgi:hypothetical protein